jgi:hypothetical protein
VQPSRSPLFWGRVSLLYLPVHICACMLASQLGCASHLDWGAVSDFEGEQCWLAGNSAGWQPTAAELLLCAVPWCVLDSAETPSAVCKLLGILTDD